MSLAKPSPGRLGFEQQGGPMKNTPLRHWAAAFACAVMSLTAAAQAENPLYPTNKSRRPVPAFPHESPSATWPQPDYFREALKLTQLRVGEPALALRSETAPRVIVLPVQTQAFGFSPAFRALLGAQLDRELAARGIDGNRQTDIVDLRGPFVRRLDDASIDEFAKRYPAASLLALHVGHDGADTAFMTLVRREPGGARTVVHRSIPLPAEPRAALAVFASQWPALIAELKLTGTAAPAVPAKAGCDAGTWQLDPPTAATRACTALAVGTLLPALEPYDRWIQPSAGSPARIAWLATAFIEASASDADPLRRAMAGLAWAQLHLDDTLLARPDRAELDDPVLAPVRRLLEGEDRSTNLPVRSARGATQQYVDQGSRSMPAFARGLLMERSAQDDGFHRVDLCAIEQAVPGMMPSPRCRDEAAAAPPASGRASPLATMLYQEWRLAAYYKDIVYVGETQGQKERLAQVLAALPADVARHPFIVQRRFSVNGLDALQGSYDEVLNQVRTRMGAFVQATAELQRYETTLGRFGISNHAATINRSMQNDATVSQLIDDERRLIAVLGFDRFSGGASAARRRTPGALAYVLAPGSAMAALQEGQNQAMAELAASSAWAPAASAPPAPPVPAAESRLFEPQARAHAATPTDAELRERIARDPRNMQDRVLLAIRSLKEGQPAAQARRVIDEFPASARVDDQVSLSHTWARPAHAYFLSGDLGDAKRYYERVREIGTGSDSDLHAGMRLPLMAGDLRAALAAGQARLARYPNDYARRDVAGLLFMTGQPDAAWAVITPRLAASDTSELWVAAAVGRRLAKQDLAATKAWAAALGADKAQVDDVTVLPWFLYRYATIDRLPTDADLATIAGGQVPAYSLNRRWEPSMRLMQMAMQGRATADDLDAVRKHLQQLRGFPARPLLPWFTWAAVHAGRPDHPDLAREVDVPLATGDFSGLLANAIRLSSQGKHELALRHLRAARHEISVISTGAQPDQPLPMAYQAALAGFLLFRETGQDAYRVEALQLARDFQGVTPYWGWPYALQALIERDTKRQAAAVCRAKALDPGSYFLSQVKPSVVAAKCPQLAW
jgi:hypothetical protein